MRIGTMPVGEVEALHGEHVTTKFFYIGPLFFPVQSYYECARGALEIPLHGRSVGVGYLRVYGPMIALFGGIALFIGMDSYRGGALIAGGVTGLVVGLALCALAFLRLGRTSPEDAARREALAAVVGFGALPAWLPDGTRLKLRNQLRAEWEEQHRAWGEPKDWQASIARGPRSRAAATLLFALASYDGGKLADEAWGHMHTAPAAAPAPAPAEREPEPKAQRRAAPAPAPKAAGRIAVRCACGTTSQVPARHAGKKVRCGDCGQATLVGAAAARRAAA